MNMTLKKTLAQLEALGNEKVFTQNKKGEQATISLGLNLETYGHWQKRLKPITS